jgi:CRP/FNR family cyclic AMP-dependent transcriptional regulator
MSEPAEIVDLLGKTAPFARLSEAALKACAAEFREKRFTQGQTIFSRGEPGDQMLLIGAGRIRLAVTTEEGRELSVRHAVRGDLIGEIAMLDGGPRSADAAALTPVVVYGLRRTQFETLIATHPEIAAGVIAFLCRKLRQTTDQLENIALHSIEVRLARYFVGALDGKKAAPGKRIPLDTEVSQTELAQLLGASRPKVNVALGVLEQAGAIRRTSDRIFCDPDLLKKFAGLADG